ncbi:MAG: pantoate--beta-alanine ligase [Pseudomonadota bacterium]
MQPDSPVRVVETRAALRAAVAELRADGAEIGFVPTMGALHEGHLSLVRIAKERGARAVASIFVNPAQFAAHEDLDNYPRTLPGDLAALADLGCDLVYVPSAVEMYPEGFATSVAMRGVAAGLESEARPHFFGGVATVVLKLLNQVRPDFAVFGEKDYQQLLVVRQLVRDFDLGIEIVGGPTAREADGLAMSSRNVKLSPEGRDVAGKINGVLAFMVERLEAGESVESALAFAVDALSMAGVDAIDYVEVRCAETLEPLDPGPLDREARVLAAVRVGGVRLIDNMGATPAE